MKHDSNIRTSFRLGKYPEYLLEKMKKMTGRPYKELFHEMFRKDLRNIVTNEPVVGFDYEDARFQSVDSSSIFLYEESARRTFVISKDTHHEIKQLSKFEDCSVDEIVNAQIVVLAYANDMAVLKIHERRVARFDAYLEVLTKLQEMSLEIGTLGIIRGPDDEGWFHEKDHTIQDEVETMLDSLERTVICKNKKLVDFDYFFGRAREK